MPQDDVYHVPDDAPAKAEAMGTKQKFWFARGADMWLFKATRPGQGEHWAEVAAAGLAQMLGLPHAEYELARWRDAAGVVTPRFTPEGYELVHGNELLAERDPAYPSDRARYVRTAEHTIDAVRSALNDMPLGLPLGWVPPAGIATATDVFAGYLLLDAWIGNTDRHHENWGIVANVTGDERHLAPTFDHASSLGAHETDERRTRRLESTDPAHSVEAYVRRAKVRSALFAHAGDGHPLGLIEALHAWTSGSPPDVWLKGLEAATDERTLDLLAALPSSEVSGPARTFAHRILGVNRKRILEVS